MTSHAYVLIIVFIIGPRCEKTCLWGFTNNTGADQPAHPHSLISAFVIRYLESIICKLATGEIRATLSSWGDWFETRFVGNLEDTFSHDEAQFLYSLDSGVDVDLFNQDLEFSQLNGNVHTEFE